MVQLKHRALTNSVMSGRPISLALEAMISLFPTAGMPSPWATCGPTWLSARPSTARNASPSPRPPPAPPVRSALRAWAPPVAARHRRRSGAEPRGPSRRLRSFGTHPERGGLRGAQLGLCGRCRVFPSGAALLHRGNPIPHLKVSLNSRVSVSLTRRCSGRRPGYSLFFTSAD